MLFLFQELQFTEAMDDLSLRLDGFHQDLEESRKVTAECLFRRLPELVEKQKEMEEVFKQIDR